MSEPKKKGISPLDFFCIGFGAMVGVGWAVSLNSWIRAAGGPVPSALGFLVLMVILVPVALCFAELVPMLPVAGGSMVFAHKAFGEKPGFIAGWAAYGGFISVLPWEAIQITDVLGYMFPGLTAGDPLYTVAGSPVYLSTIILGCLVAILLFLLNMRGLAAAAGLQKVLCVVLVLAGVIGSIASVVGGSIHNIEPLYDTSNPLIYGTDPGLVVPTHHSFLTGVIAALPLFVFFLTGFETIPQGIEDAGGNPGGVGRTIFIAVILSCFFYAMVCFCYGFGIPWQQFVQPVASGGTITNPSAATVFLQVFEGGAGKGLYWLITCGALAGLLTTWNGFFRPSANLMMGMARGRMIPGKLAKQNEAGIPRTAMIISLVLSMVGPFVGIGVINNLTIFSGTAYVISWMLASYSQWKLRKTMPDADRPYKAPGGALCGLFGGVAMTILLVLMFIPGNPCFIGGFAITMLLIWMGIGVVLYFLTGPERNKLTPEEREKLLFPEKE